MSATKPNPDATGAEIVPLRQATPLSDEIVLALAEGNLRALKPADRAAAIRRICEDGDLPVSMSPVILIPGDQGALKPYVTAIGASWVATNQRLSMQIVSEKTEGELRLVRVRASAPDGRIAEATGAVAVKGLAGTMLANAYMKCETKAYRRAALRFAGLPMIDADEGTAPPVRVDYETGEILEAEGRVVQADDRPEMPGDNDEWERENAAIHAAASEKFPGEADSHDAVHDLVCARFGIDTVKIATPAMLRIVRAVIQKWDPAWSQKAVEWVRLIGECTTEEELARVRTVLQDDGVRDGLLKKVFDRRWEAVTGRAPELAG